MKKYDTRYLEQDVNEFEIIYFFSYTSCIREDDNNCIFSYDGMSTWEKNEEAKDKFDYFYQSLAEKARLEWKEKTGEDKYITFRDNKTVFCIRSKFSGQTIFIGRYDGYRKIGHSCYLFDGYVYNFKNGKKTDYMSDVYCSGGGLYKRFELK